MNTFIRTEFGLFRKVAANDEVLVEDKYVFQCPGCGEWAYLDDDQWYGKVSVDHASMGCIGGYHETHDYVEALSKGIKLKFCDL